MAKAKLNAAKPATSKAFHFPKASDFDLVSKLKDNSEKEPEVKQPEVAVVKPVVPAVQSTTAPTKADLARVVFDRCYGMNPVPQRKDIIEMAVKEAGLTKPGASTYLQNYKTKKGLVRAKAVPA